MWGHFVSTMYYIHPPPHIHTHNIHSYVCTVAYLVQADDESGVSSRPKVGDTSRTEYPVSSHGTRYNPARWAASRGGSALLHLQTSAQGSFSGHWWLRMEFSLNLILLRAALLSPAFMAGVASDWSALVFRSCAFRVTFLWPQSLCPGGWMWTCFLFWWAYYITHYWPETDTLKKASSDGNARCPVISVVLRLSQKLWWVSVTHAGFGTSGKMKEITILHISRVYITWVVQMLCPWSKGCGLKSQRQQSDVTGFVFTPIIPSCFKGCLILFF